MKTGFFGFALVACGAVAWTACAAQDTGRDDGIGGASGKADELDDGGDAGATDLAHRDWILTCDELAERVVDRTNDERVDEIVRAERTRQNCLALANDSVIETIDNALMNIESAEAGRTESRFTAHRDSFQDLCNSFVEGSAGALDKTGAVLSQRCTADGERALGDLIDAFVALSVDAITIAESRVVYGGCYDDLDATAPVGHAAEVEALETLGACIQAENDAMRTRLIAKIVESFPGRSPADLEEETYRYLRGAQDNIDNLCSSLSAAGEASDDNFVEMQYVQCIVAANAHIGEIAVSVEPTLFDGVGSGGGGSTGGGDTGGTGGTGGTTGG